MAQSEVARPDPEVAERAVRRHFTAEFKLQVLREADACREPGDTGRLLRRYGLYSSHLTVWRRERELAAKAGLDRKRGPRPKGADPLVRQVAELQKEVQELTRRLKQASTIIDVQKKVSEIFGITLDTPQNGGND